MKKYSAILSVLFAVLFFASCEKDSISDIANRPYATLEGSTVDGAVTRVRFESTDKLVSMPALDENGVPQDYSTTLSASLFGAPLTSDVTVDFEIVDTTGAKLGQEFTLSATQFVIPAGELSGSIDINVSNAEMPLDSVAPFLLKLTAASAGVIDTFFNVNQVRLYKNCLLDYTKFAGNYTNFIDGAENAASIVELFDDADYSQGLLIMQNFWYDDQDSMRLELKDDGTIVSPLGNQFINNQNAYGAYGRIMFEDIEGGLVTNNCTPIFVFTATPTLPDSGYWWGGPYDFMFIKDSKGHVTVKINKPIGKPVKDPRR